MASLLFSDPIATADLPDALRSIYSTELEFTARPNLVYDQFTESKEDFRQRRGETVTWTIYRQLPPALAVLTETTDVDGGKMSDFQVSFSVHEYGYAIGTSEKLDLLSYQGPISNIVRQVLAPQMALTLDLLARNAFFSSAATYRNYVGTATARAGVTSSDVITDNVIRLAAYNLSVRRIPLIGGSYVAIVHPSVVYDIRGLSYWKDAQLYAGSTDIFNGEVGSLHGVRFIEADNARLPNAGASAVSTTLGAAIAVGDTTITVASSTGMAVGMEITVFAAAASTPDGTGSTEESLVIKSITNSTTVVLKRAALMAHPISDKVVDAVDIYPVAFLGAEKPLGKGIVVDPEVRVALPVDRLKRIHFVGWYALLGYGVLRDWALEIWEMASSVNSAPAFNW